MITVHSEIAPSSNMPVLPTNSPSPERYERSPTPEPVGQGEGSSKRPRLTTDGIQRYKASDD